MFDTAKQGGFTAVNGESSSTQSKGNVTSFRPMTMPDDEDTLVLPAKRRERSPAPASPSKAAEEVQANGASPVKRKRSSTVEGDVMTPLTTPPPDEREPKRLATDEAVTKDKQDQPIVSSPRAAEETQSHEIPDPIESDEEPDEPRAASEQPVSENISPRAVPAQVQELQTNQDERQSSDPAQSVSDESEDQEPEPADRAGSDEQAESSKPVEFAEPNQTDTPPTKTRKREFSHRTKTGCHTCRFRKKKCDEGKPTCANCARGNFRCGGYGPRAPVGFKVLTNPTPATAPRPNPNAYTGPARAAGSPDPRWAYHSQYPPRAEPPPPPYGPVSHAYASRHDYGPDPRERERAAYPQYPEHINLQHNHLADVDYRHVPAPATYAAPPPSHAPPPPQGQWPPRQYESPRPPAPRTVYSAHESVASSGSRKGSQLPPMHALSERDEQERLERHRYEQERRSETKLREDMISGHPYKHWETVPFAQDRKECGAAVEAYNRAQLPSENLGHETRAQRFMAILDPSKRTYRTSREPPPYKGRVGIRTVVESPFHCDYGYNIKIGNDVAIGGGCYIQDPCEVRIGDRCILGRDVKICGMTAPIHFQERNGSQGTVLGGAVTIEEDVYIGAGAIIHGYRHIARGAYIEPGSVVSRNVPAFTVVAGNPAIPIKTIDGRPTPLPRYEVDVEAENSKMRSLMREQRDRRNSYPGPDY